MKHFIAIVVFSLLSSAAFTQTVFTYGTEKVSKEEFLRAYNKNNTAAINKNTALREYLDLYIKFKLKVKAAQDMRIDTLANINDDLQNFRSQIEEGYLTDEKAVSSLVQEAFSRSQKDIHITHLFIPVDKSALAADTLIIYEAAKEAYEGLTKNGSFQEAAEKLKSKTLTVSIGDLGFITVFSIPYEFENIVYQLKPGQVSTLYRSKTGYHFFKNEGEREPAGKIKIAQILIAEPPGANNDQASKRLADSIYNRLLAGEDFSEMARNVSNDKNTYLNGGAMPEFGTGKYEPVFESQAFALAKDNDISAPFHTAFGYHILKRLSRTPVPKEADPEYLSALKQQVLADPRISIAREKFLVNVLKTLGYNKNTGINQEALWRTTDTFSVNNKKITLGNLDEKTVLFSFNDSKITVNDWLTFSNNYKSNPDQYKGESYDELMEKFISNTAFEHYREQLEQYNPDFRYQLQEFKDGNMLFEIMEKNVWSKASGDSAGLVKFFEKNKARYNWNESADVILITCANKKIADHAAEQLRAGKTWQQIVEDSSAQIQADSGRYELTQIPVKLNTKPAPQTITEPLVNDADSTASFVKIIQVYPANKPRSFEEARGLVINDYQNYLEENWITELKQKYPVKIDESVVSSLVN